MAAFKFSSSRALMLDIEGHIFKVEPNGDLSTKLRRFGSEAQTKGAALRESDGSDAAVEDACAFCLDAVDQVLGEGAAQVIFTDRTVNLFDCIDLLRYLLEEINAYNARLASQYQPTKKGKR